jgi:cell division protein FtsX
MVVGLKEPVAPKVPKRWTLKAIWHHTGLPVFMSPSERVLFNSRLAVLALWRNPIVSLTSFVALGLVFTVLWGMSLWLVGSVVSLSEHNREVAVTIFFDENADSVRQSKVVEGITNHFPEADVVFIDAETARKEVEQAIGMGQKKTFGSYSDLDDSVYGTLPPSLEIILPASERSRSTVEALRSVAYSLGSVADVYFNSDQVELAEQQVRGKHRTMALVVVVEVVLVLAGICLITLLGRLALLSRIRELQTSSLLGAYGADLWAPFCFEAILYGLFAGIGAGVLLSCIDSQLGLFGETRALLPSLRDSMWFVFLCAGSGAFFGAALTALAGAAAWRTFSFESD